MKKKTVGQASVDLAKKEVETRDPIELERAAHTDYEKNVLECLERSKKDFFGSDFYIVVLTKKERLMTNVLRHYYFGRLSCPTPDYDQAVYHYKNKDDKLSFCWVLPSRDTCQLFRENALQIDKSEKELLGHVLDFYSGKLFTMAKILNNEKIDSPYIEH